MKKPTIHWQRMSNPDRTGCSIQLPAKLAANITRTPGEVTCKNCLRRLATEQRNEAWRRAHEDRVAELKRQEAEAAKLPAEEKHSLRQELSF